MRGIGVVRAWSVLLVGAGLAVAVEEPPPLTAPALITPGGDAGLAAPAERPSAAAPSPGPGGTGPILVVPGVTAPARMRSTPRLPELEPAGPEPSADVPALIGPGGTMEPRSPGAAATAPRAASGGLSNPLTLESVPSDEPIISTPAPMSPPPAPRPAVRDAKPVPPPPSPAPRRSSGLFGRMLMPSFITGRGAGESRSTITVEPRTDPAADAALKRRIEHQIQEALGDRIRSVEVRVVGRDVTIHAKTARFWQRRNVRRTLESLPGLSGYHATFEVED
jgi:hypothetical protein